MSDDTAPSADTSFASASQIRSCFSCGRSFEGKGRFCSDRCRDWFDVGNSPYDVDYASKSKTRWYSLPIGATGFLINCLGCGKPFDSWGLRCCSSDCERRFREREENLRLMAQAGMAPPTKHRCEACDTAIPTWRNGRRVPVGTRFCSDRCRARSRRNRPAGAKGQKAGSVTPNRKKVPVNWASAPTPPGSGLLGPNGCAR